METGTDGQLACLLSVVLRWVDFFSSLKTVLLLFFSLLECRPGSYGSNCSLNCSSYCEEKGCDRYSGECLYDCTPGYQMPNCVMRNIYLKFSLYLSVQHYAITIKITKDLQLKQHYMYMHHNCLRKKKRCFNLL